MSEAREELLRLAREIPDEEVSAALAAIQTLLRPPGEPTWPPPWFGAASGHGTDIDRRSDEVLTEGFGQ